MLKHCCKYFLFVSMMVLLFLPVIWLPFLQEHFHSLQVKKLVGVFDQTQHPKYWGNKWVTGEYQSAYEQFLKDKNPILPLSVRIKAQLDYSLFGDVMHNNMVTGPNTFIYKETDCYASIGKDFKGKAWLENKVKKLRQVIDYFKKDSIPFLVLTPPAKSTVMSEFLPPFYKNYPPTDSTNWKTITTLFQKYQIPYIDFSYFEKLKNEVPYRLYPQGGLHWTNYGSTIAADSITKYMQNLLNIEMVQMQWDSVEMSTAKVTFDNEMIAGANFLWAPPLDPLPYPVINYIETENTTKPKVLSVGDSFYFLMYKYGIPDRLFHKETTFWYYAHEIKPLVMKDGKRLWVHDLDIMEEIKKRDLVLLTVYEENLDRFAFNFIDMVFEKIE